LLAVRDQNKTWLNKKEGFFEARPTNIETKFFGGPEQDIYDLLIAFSKSQDGLHFPPQVIGHHNQVNGRIEWLIVIPTSVYLGVGENPNFPFSFGVTGMKFWHLNWNEDWNTRGNSNVSIAQAECYNVRDRITNVFWPYIRAVFGSKDQCYPAFGNVHYASYADDEDQMTYQVCSYTPNATRRYKGLTFFYIE